MTVVSQSVFDKMLKRKVLLKPTSRKLRTYTGEIIKPVGEAEVKVQIPEKSDVFKNLTLIVLPGNRSCLIGRNWLTQLKLNWNEIFSQAI